MTIWYLNNSNEPEQFVTDGQKNQDGMTIDMLNPRHRKALLETGVVINSSMWIPPHRILRIDL